MIENVQVLPAPPPTNPATKFDSRLTNQQLLQAQPNQTIANWEQTVATQPNKTVHQLFEQQVAQTPEKTAVFFADTPLTYEQLNQQANQLARHLQTLGITPGAFVGLHLDRSLSMIVAILATLKAGGAYIPLDPTLPASRLNDILQATEPAVILSQSSLATELPATTFANNLVCLDQAVTTLDDYSQANLLSSTTSSELAYILFTSGSTGKPKGAEIPHRAVVNFLNTMREEPGMTADDVTLALTTLSFDIAVLEIFLPLTVGAALVLAPSAAARNAEQIDWLLQQHDVTIMQATPATWRMLLLANWNGKLGLKMLCGGEAMPVSLAQQLLSKGDSLWNMYGPTETTVWSVIYEVSGRDTTGKAATIPIGYPVGNTQLYVVDQNLQRVPDGEVGELLIGGAGLAHGYHNRPDLTAAAFIDNPFGAGRLYRTGDLVRYRPFSHSDAPLEFLGRRDHQVKIRGFRIELGEIEAVLTQYPNVHAAAVTTHTTLNDLMLVAYLVPKDGNSNEMAQAVQDFLRARLPAYMIPATYIMLDSFPLTPSGKINRRALPEPTLSSTATSYVAPRSKTEGDLVQLWEEILQVEAIGVNDNFFALGGHSLLATQFVSRAQAAGLKVTIEQLFAQPTIADLAGLLAHPTLTQIDNAPSTSPLLVPLQPKGTRPPLFLIHPIMGVTYPYMQLAHLLDKNQPVYGLRSLGLAESEQPEQSIPAMAKRYIAAIQTMQPAGPYFLGGWSFGGWVAHEMAYQLTEAGHEVALLALLDTPYRSRTDALWTKLQRGLAFSQLVAREIWPYLRGYREIATASASKTGTKAWWRQPIIKQTLKVYWGNLKATWAYLPKDYEGRLTLFQAEAQSSHKDEGLGWNGRFLNITPIPGNHLTMMREPHVATLAQALQAALNEQQVATS